MLFPMWMLICLYLRLVSCMLILLTATATNLICEHHHGHCACIILFLCMYVFTQGLYQPIRRSHEVLVTIHHTQSQPIVLLSSSPQDSGVGSCSDGLYHDIALLDSQLDQIALQLLTTACCITATLRRTEYSL